MRALFLLALLAGTCSAFYDGEESKVVNLESLDEVMEADDALWLIEFYAPWCGHCKNLAPTYEKVAANLQGLVKVGALDCDKHPEVATKIGIQGFPTLKVYTPEKTYNPYTKKSAKQPTDYKGPRTAKGMVSAVLEMLPNYVTMVKPGEEETFLSGDYPKAVLFTDKEAVPSLFKAAALQFKGRMRFGQVQSTDKELASKFGVEEFPKVVALTGSDPSKAVKHEGKIKSAEIAEFLGAHALKEKKTDPLLEAKKPKLAKALSAETFQTDVEGDKGLWLVFFHKGTVPSSFEDLANSFKSFKAGTVDCTKEAQLCKDQVATTLPMLRLFMSDKGEYEDFTGGADCLEDCMELEAMSDWVQESIPNVVVPVTDATFQSFLAPAVERPRVLLLSKKADPTALYKSLALNYKDVLPLGLFANPQQQILAQIGVKKLPQLLIFFSQNATEDSVQAFPYQGGFTYEEITNVIDQFAEPFREGYESKKSSQGKAASPAPTGPLPEMTSTEEGGYESLCGKKGGLCAVAFLDGSEANKEKREEQLKVLETLRTKMHPSPFHMSWVDAVCHPDFAMSFDVSSDKLPTLAVISPSKQRYVQHVGKFAVDELGATLQGVLSGKKQTGPYSSVNPLEKRQCADVHAEILAAISGGGSEEDDEIMREMMEEIKRKQEEEGDDDDDGAKKKKTKKKRKKAKK
mmetsp:Transcript_16509/g.40319  ORF Transcript_16509/g.40319 Transcript_16509/m.40319 type:complete len:688 (-) Transcript_16509:96-2159(-)|eukprot:CAMPEP_0206231928 /NCGR_PEP_ID=MMETSP0047_2-20121206/11115_1 /ASSEMBLY_ACC=CAM_ASM_000192 /TAXON_ID=195065 /ORGANISM="Chroomonas mesostigmatica_cf, Strain CCMP1168" /LENGTH=687 /DNA_ID=CAMNT_0053655573 /DNA_START=70 /DNA_END=2133 /DNA_ORIENTATION=-